MFGNIRRGSIRPFRAYLPKALKFYGIKNEKLCALIFILILGVSFTANLISLSFATEIDLSRLPLSNEEMLDLFKSLMMMNAVNLGTFILINLFTSIYLFAYIKDLRGIQYNFKDCGSFFFRKAIPLIVLSVINVLAIFTGLFLFIVPGIIIYLMFIFGNCSMVDKNTGIFGSLKSSIYITNGLKSQIFSIIIIFNIIILFVTTFLGNSGGMLIYAFISAFISSIVNLMYQRLIALMYMDIEYSKNINDKIEMA
jgi:acid phosphatase family membrane protein YuiD